MPLLKSPLLPVDQFYIPTSTSTSPLSYVANAYRIIYTPTSSGKGNVRQIERSQLVTIFEQII